ncbi:MAG: hypothetical protein L3J56_02820 [Bacteroidales bacterium]|nr:hypothetical protein [Bacteroidales bacterium]
MKAFFNTLFRTFYREPQPHRVFFMKTENILNTDADKAGVINEVQHDPKYKFEEIKLTEKPEIETVQKGMTSVTQDLVLKFSNPGHIFNDLNALKDNKKGISILHLSPNNQAYLYGEHKGLQIIEITKDTLILEGEEADTFFYVDFELALKIIESKS